MTETVHIDHLNLRDMAGAVAFSFTCPRCEAMNKAVIPTAFLDDGYTLTCRNPACGGDGTFEFYIGISGQGWMWSKYEIPLIEGLSKVDSDLRDVLLVVTRRKRTVAGTVAKELGITVKEAQRRLRLLTSSGALECVDVFYSAKVPYVEV